MAHDIKHVEQPTSQAGSLNVSGSSRRSMFSICSERTNMSRIFSFSLLALLLASCNESPTMQDKMERNEAAYARMHPIGRYQMTGNPEGQGVYVLDTVDGSLRSCVEAKLGTRGQVGVGCTPERQAD